MTSSATTSSAAWAEEELQQQHKHPRPRSKPRVAPEDRVYEPDGFYLRAACLCVRDASEREVLLVSSPRWGPDCWLVPGGKLQLGESSEGGAAREALEEAGAVGAVGRCLGSFDNGERRHRTRVYVLRVTALLEHYQEGDVRRRAWFGLEEAKRLLAGHHVAHCDYVTALAGGGERQMQNPQAVNNDSSVGTS